MRNFKHLRLSREGACRLAAVALAAMSLNAGAVGLVTNNNGSVITLDPATNTFGASAGGIANNGVVGDCVISSDGSTAYVTNFGYQIFPVDLTGATPVIGVPFSTSQQSEDVDLTPNGKYLLVTNGGSGSPLSSIDTATRTVVSDLALASNTVDACADGTHVVSGASGSIHLIDIDGGGNLTLNMSTAAGDTINAYCAPNSTTAYAISYSGSVQSFAIPGLAPISSVATVAEAQSAAINAAGTMIYVRGASTTAAHPLDPATGSVGAAAWTVPTAFFASSYYGIEQIALSPDGSALYLPHGGGVQVLDPATGAVVTDLSSASVSSGVGICFSGGGGQAPVTSRLPTASFLSGNDVAAEGQSVTVTLGLSRKSTVPVRVHLSARGSATKDADYSLTPQDIVFAPGALYATATIDVADDQLQEPTENVILEIETDDNAFVGSPSSYELRILDNDVAPLVSLQVSGSEIFEGDAPVQLTAALSGPAARTVFVLLSYRGSAAIGVDYQAPRYILIPAGRTSATMDIQALSDGLVEDGEQVDIAISYVFNAVPVAPASASILIHDADAMVVEKRMATAAGYRHH